MVEKKIRNFYNSVQFTGTGILPVRTAKPDLIALAVRAALGIAAAVALAKGVMFLADSALRRVRVKADS